MDRSLFEEMITLRHREDCCGCCSCAAACPHGAIRMEADGMGFRYPVIDKDLCTNCGLCEKVCAFRPITTSAQPKAEAIRFPEYLDKSQSGGLGYALMRKAIGEGYVVYGAAMDADFVVRHRRVETLEGLEPLRLSKYVQSDMDGIPEQVLADLKAGRKVLFTGTPCQCAGIGSLCAKYRENLLLADIVCRSVPSPNFWQDFVNEAQKHGELKRILFRDPELDWHNRLTRLEYYDHTEHNGEYYFLFRNGYLDRPSCGKCHFREAHPSDITMGDCWGVDKLLPGFADDNRGCSLLLVNTPAGSAFTFGLEEGVKRKEVSVLKVLSYSHKEPSPLAETVEKAYLCRGYSYVNFRYGINSPSERIKRLLHKLNPTNTKLYRKLIK